MSGHFLSQFLRGFVGRALAVTVPEMGDFMSHIATVNASVRLTCLCRAVRGVEEALFFGAFPGASVQRPSVSPNAAG